MISKTRSPQVTAFISHFLSKIQRNGDEEKAMKFFNTGPVFISKMKLKKLKNTFLLSSLLNFGAF